jgi:hypothetical protein
MSEPELHEKEKKPPPPLLHRKNSNGSSLKPAADEKPAVTAICQLPLLGESLSQIHALDDDNLESVYSCSAFKIFSPAVL